MLSYDEALALILSSASTLPAERVPLTQAANRFLARDIITPHPLPPFDNSQMDGFAVQSADLRYASPSNPIVLPLAGIYPAGISTGNHLPGYTSRLMTGAPVPVGADAVVAQEDVSRGINEVTFTECPVVGQFIRFAGEDVKSNATVLRAGTRIGPGAMAMLAATGNNEVLVTRQPVVSIITTGDELVEPGGPIAVGQIYNSNAYALGAQIEDAGGIVAIRNLVPDDPRLLRNALLACAGSDVIISSGGVSVGDRDYIKEIITEIGQISLWRAAIRPGKPILFGHVGDAIFLGLPGNPVSSLVTFELFGRTLLLKLQGAGQVSRRIIPAILAEDVTHEPGRRSFLRVKLDEENGTLKATTLGPQGSGMIRSVVGFDGLLILPEDQDGFLAGESASVILMD